MEAEGTFHDGGAMLDDAGRMVGSMRAVELGPRAEVDVGPTTDPFVRGRSRDHINGSARPRFRLAVTRCLAPRSVNPSKERGIWTADALETNAQPAPESGPRRT